MSEKIKILVIPSDRYGVGYYRSSGPHVKMSELFGDDFDIEINYDPDFNNLEYFEKFDVVNFSKGLYQEMGPFYKAMEHCKEKGVKIVMDIDDYWDVPQTHPQFRSAKNFNLSELTKRNLKLADYVTTTTDIFAEKIKQFNSNVFVFPNAIDPEEEQFKPIKNQSNKIRFGFVMGSSHGKDMEQFMGFVNSLPKDILDKIQIVLCGFDTRGSVTMFDKNTGEYKTRDIMPHESIWFNYECTLTNNYKLVSDEYRKYLMTFNKYFQWPNVDNEFYRREWTMDVREFGKHYRNIDVLFAPLTETTFNSVKSELKLIEAGFTHTAVIASNFGPYTIGTKNMFDKNGVINEDGNCILIDNRKAHKDWAKAVKKLVENPELITKLQNNLYNSVKDEYNINNVAKNRADWYKSILGR